MSLPDKLAGLKPGRELDALVAERVMGKEIVGYVSAWGECGYDSAHPEPGEHPAYVEHCICDEIRGADERFGLAGASDWIHGHHWQCLGIAPLYSTDIAAAWQVVEKMEADGWGWTADRRSAAGDPFQYPWRFHKGARLGRSDSRTVPLAICLAALKAVEDS